ncbi:unnamed protein product [Prorocentrum cordatum]|nr:unnamed protein product [Polarella glacialis]
MPSAVARGRLCSSTAPPPVGLFLARVVPATTATAPAAAARAVTPTAPAARGPLSGQAGGPASDARAPPVTRLASAKDSTGASEDESDFQSTVIVSSRRAWAGPEPATRGMPLRDTASSGTAADRWGTEALATVPADPAQAERCSMHVESTGRSAPDMEADLSRVQVLFVACPGDQGHCSGEYWLQQGMANGMPLWRRAGSGEERWLFRWRINGHWVIGGAPRGAPLFSEDDIFKSTVGFVDSERGPCVKVSTEEPAATGPVAPPPRTTALAPVPPAAATAPPGTALAPATAGPEDTAAAPAAATSSPPAAAAPLAAPLACFASPVAVQPPQTPRLGHAREAAPGSPQRLGPSLSEWAALSQGGDSGAPGSHRRIAENCQRSEQRAWAERDAAQARADQSALQLQSVEARCREAVSAAERDRLAAQELEGALELERRLAAEAVESHSLAEASLREAEGRSREMLADYCQLQSSLAGERAECRGLRGQVARMTEVLRRLGGPDAPHGGAAPARPPRKSEACEAEGEALSLKEDICQLDAVVGDVARQLEGLLQARPDPGACPRPAQQELEQELAHAQGDGRRLAAELEAARLRQQLELAEAAAAELRRELAEARTKAGCAEALEAEALAKALAEAARSRALEQEVVQARAEAARIAREADDVSLEAARARGLALTGPPTLLEEERRMLLEDIQRYGWTSKSWRIRAASRCCTGPPPRTTSPSAGSWCSSGRTCSPRTTSAGPRSSAPATPATRGRPRPWRSCSPQPQQHRRPPSAGRGASRRRRPTVRGPGAAPRATRAPSRARQTCPRGWSRWCGRSTSAAGRTCAGRRASRRCTWPRRRAARACAPSSWPRARIRGRRTTRGRLLSTTPGSPVARARSRSSKARRGEAQLV